MTAFIVPHSAPFEKTQMQKDVRRRLFAMCENLYAFGTMPLRSWNIAYYLRDSSPREICGMKVSANSTTSITAIIGMILAAIRSMDTFPTADA